MNRKPKNFKTNNNHLIHMGNQNNNMQKNSQSFINKKEKFNQSIKGFINNSNNCYINSFLQILLHTPNFLRYLNEYNDNDYNENNTLIFNLKGLSLATNDGKIKLYINNIKEIMGEVKKTYNSQEQGDSQYFGIDLIDKLISEVKHEKSFDSCISAANMDLNISKQTKYEIFKNEYNNKHDYIERLFQFIEVKKGLNDNLDFYSIQLHIELIFPNNIKNNDEIDLIKLLNLKYDNNLKIADLPEIFIITFDRGIHGKKLIKTNVKYPLNLDFKEYIDKEDYIEIGETKYILYALNERSGLYKNQGHYTCKIKIYKKEGQTIKEKCYTFSDNNVWISGSHNFSNICDICGLYYIRVDCFKEK